MYNGSFYNPYTFGTYQAASNIGRTGFGLKGLIKGFNFSNFLTSTGKTLNVINQAIPIFYQVKPIFSNAKTMLRVMGAVRESNNTNNNVIKQNNINSYKTTNIIKENNITNHNLNNYNSTSNNPTFFL